MAEPAAPEWRAFSIELDYTDAELLSLQRVVGARRKKPGDARWSWWTVFLSVGTGFLILGAAARNWFWWTVLLSIAIGFLVVGTAIRLGLADHDTAGLLGITIVVTFWLGVYLPSLFLRRSQRRRQFSQFREDWRGASLLISPRGVVLRRPHIRSAYAPASITGIISEGGFVLLWIGRRPFAIPERLLTAERRANLLAMRPRAAGDSGGTR